VAIVGVDNDDILCRMSTPPLSSVGLDNERIGYEAARLLDRMIRGAKTPSEPVLIPPRRLVIRHSSDVIAIDDPEISATMRFIREHADKPINVKDLLRHVPVSRSSMEMRFERLFGRTPSAAITCVHMELAKNLLAETNLSIGAVARNSGYTNQEIFSVSFRRELGLTPTQYRQKSRMDGTTARDYQHQRA
jgi:LacI family transcriptional regulator